jgi:hypothetical protein
MSHSPRAKHPALAGRDGSGSHSARLTAVLQRAPAVPAVQGDPRSDPGAVALPVDAGQIRALPHLLDVAGDADVGVLVAFVEHVEGDLGIAARVLQPLAGLVHVHQDRPLSYRYQVAADTGWPSRRNVVMTAGFGLRSITTAAREVAVLTCRASKSCGDASRWHAARSAGPYTRRADPARIRRHRRVRLDQRARSPASCQRAAGRM